jgi:NAD(P)-dependent dehydrogenase (short-subunit alcohol dehydrogenase family)
MADHSIVSPQGASSLHVAASFEGAAVLKGRVAVVTGGSRGIGLATARALRQRGAAVAITGTTDRGVAKAAAALAQEPGAAVLGLRADVRSFEDVERAFATVNTEFGGIDILVNNAGVGIFRPVAEMTSDEWSLIMDTNVTGVFNGCRAVVPHLRRRGGGWIINISSLSATNPFVGGAAYCASKAALNAFSEAFMQEVRHDGIRVSYVQPGSVDTEFAGGSPSKSAWALKPEDVAQVVSDLVGYPSRSLPSRVEIRPSQPPKKG